jgi:endonuclease/exonuclease/phosphatase family metal-dependent hydrolase
LDVRALLFLLPLAQFAIGWSLARLLSALQPRSDPLLMRISVATGLSMLLLVIFLFLTYGALILSMPFPKGLSLPILCGLLALLTLTATLRTRKLSTPGSKQFAPILIPAAFLVMTIAYSLFPSARSPITSHASLPLKVMTYNIHSAISPFGQPDAEAIARVIESSGADLAALQEISRGWLASGSTDLVSWLSRRLGMYAVFKGTADPLWGNAILSRYPFIESGHGDLPQLSSLIPRGCLWVKLDVGSSQPLFVIATHLHHFYPGEEVRMAQIETILEEWNGAPYTIFLGDLNAAPDTHEIQTIKSAGFIDAWAASGVGQGFTLSSLAPDVRVDWIWHTPDLITTEIKVIQSVASDHLPVIAEITAAK